MHPSIYFGIKEVNYVIYIIILGLQKSSKKESKDALTNLYKDKPFQELSSIHLRYYLLWQVLLLLLLLEL